jgi:Fe-Mn family superoxide dismutase
MKKFTLAPLPYAEDALEPFVSRETIAFHYHKHHQAYVDKLNTLIEKTPWEGRSLEDIVRGTFQKDVKIFNQAGQVWNHDFYWQSLRPAPKGKSIGPDGELKRAIEAAWGSFDNFQGEFFKVATALFGSGWAWLESDSSGMLSIEATQNADNPLRQGRKALLCVDVWEHAYYIDYRNERAKYLEKVAPILNWEFAEQNFALRGKLAA